MPKKISIFSLVMINIAALGGIRTWAPIAECGLSSAFFLILGVLIFFLPLSLVAAELTTAWPKNGGVYVWVKEAFGHRLGFLAIWFLWVQNVIWYPTLLSFIAATLSYVFNPTLSMSPWYNVSLILILFWGATFLNLLGMRISSWVSTIGAVCGTFIPSFIIIGLGLFWYLSGQPSQVSFNIEYWIPKLSSLPQMALFVGVLVSLLGMEMSAVHAGDVIEPQKNYPRAILFSALAVVFFPLLGVLAIIMVIPPSALSLNAGCLQAFEHFFKAYDIEFLIPVLAILIALGAVGSMSTWLLGPCKGLLAAAEKGDLPAVFKKTNKRGVPQNLLLMQAAIVSLLALLFLWMPSINSAYWILLVLTTQLYLLMYLLLFSAAIKLYYKFPDVERPFRIPGGAAGLWVMAGLGFISSLLSFVIGFFPPQQLSGGNPQWYMGFLAISILILSLLPSLIFRMHKPSEVSHGS